MPSTLQLQSSSTLGSGRTLTAQEKLEKTEDKEVFCAIYSRQTSGRFAGDIAESDKGEEVLDNNQISTQNAIRLKMAKAHRPEVRSSLSIQHRLRREKKTCQMMPLLGARYNEMRMGPL